MYEDGLISPPVDFFIDKILSKETFCFAKLNHSYWQILAKEEPIYSQSLYTGINGIDKKFPLVIRSILKKMEPSEDFCLACDLYGPPGIVIAFNKDKLFRLIKKIVPKKFKLYWSAIWKKYALTGDLLRFFDAINNYKVLVVGLNHLEPLMNNKINGEFLEVDIRAALYKEELLESILNKTNPGDIILLQCGCMLSFWLIFNLRGSGRTCIDVGRALDIYLPDRKINSSLMPIFPDFYNQKWMTLKSRFTDRIY